MDKHIDTPDEVWEYYKKKSQEYGIVTADKSIPFKTIKEVDNFFYKARENFMNYWEKEA